MVKTTQVKAWGGRRILASGRIQDWATPLGCGLVLPRLAAVTPSFSLAQERLLLIQILPNAEREGLTLPHPCCLVLQFRPASSLSWQESRGLPW